MIEKMNTLRQQAMNDFQMDETEVTKWCRYQINPAEYALIDGSVEGFEGDKVFGIPIEVTESVEVGQMGIVMDDLATQLTKLFEQVKQVNGLEDDEVKKRFHFEVHPKDKPRVYEPLAEDASHGFIRFNQMAVQFTRDGSAKPNLPAIIED